VSAPRSATTNDNEPGGILYGLLSLDSADALPPEEFDQISLSAPLPISDASGTASLINFVEAGGIRERIAAASVTKTLPKDMSIYATAFIDLANRANAGVFAGLSIPLGPDVSASVEESTNAGSGTSISFEAQKTLQNRDGDYGWRIQDTNGAAPYRSVDASYRSPYGVGEVDVQQQNGSTGASAKVTGSIAALGGGAFIGNSIPDSFAVVDAGVAGVPVLEDNRPVGVTNSSGKLLVPNLRSDQVNSISIDPTSLPVSAEASTTVMRVAPARSSGVYLNFGVERDAHAAIVIITGKDGLPMPPGSKGKLNASGETFIVGYDGEAYIKHLAKLNAIVVDDGENECHASFAFSALGSKLYKIGPVVCN
jgi:outer membrane usher protein